QSSLNWQRHRKPNPGIMRTDIQNNQNNHATFKSMLRAVALMASVALSFGGRAPDFASYSAVQTLAQGGGFPVNGLAGDAFGQVVTFNKKFLFVSSPGSQPDNKRIAGAVFVYRWNGAQYQQTQIITTGGTGDHLGMLQILSDQDWLILGAIG